QIAHRSLEGAVAVAQEHAHSSAVHIAGHQVSLAVPIEVGDSQIEGGDAGVKFGSHGVEYACAVPQENSHLALGIVTGRNHDISAAVAVEVGHHRASANPG